MGTCMFNCNQKSKLGEDGASYKSFNGNNHKDLIKLSSLIRVNGQQTQHIKTPTTKPSISEVKPTPQPQIPINMNINVPRTSFATTNVVSGGSSRTTLTSLDSLNQPYNNYSNNAVKVLAQGQSQFQLREPSQRQGTSKSEAIVITSNFKMRPVKRLSMPCESGLMKRRFVSVDSQN